MLKYIARRLLGAIPVLFGLSIILFAFVHLLPGDPVDVAPRTARDPGAAPRRSVAQLGLDQPLYQQYFLYLSQLAQGDLGKSIINNRTGRRGARAALPGDDRADRRGAPVRRSASGSRSGGWPPATPRAGPTALVTIISLLGISIPIFVLGLTHCSTSSPSSSRWLPAAGRIDPRLHLEVATELRADRLAARRELRGVRRRVEAPDPAGDRARLDPARDHHAGSPAPRSSTSTTRTTSGPPGPRACPRSGSIRRHIMRNAWLPVVTVIGLQVGGLLAGAVITETVFSWPGVGATSSTRSRTTTTSSSNRRSSCSP